MKSKWLWIAVLALLVAASVGGVWASRAAKQRQAVVAALPAPPDLSTALEPLQDAVAAAGREAHSLLHARRGLAELSRLYHANGFLDEAVRCYIELEKLQPEEPRWFHRHAAILAGYGDVNAALPLWQRVVKLAPDYIPAWLRIGDCQLKGNHPEEAATTYEAVRAKQPDNPYALWGLARIAYESGQWEQARERLEPLVQQTNFQLGYDLIVSVYERLGQTDQARAIRGVAKASGAYRDPPDPWIDDLLDDCYDPFRLALAAGAIARGGDPAKALQLLQRAVELAPSDVSSRFQLANLYVEQHELAQGREQLERCTAIAPDFSDGWVRLSDLQKRAGEAAAAARTLEAGLQHCPQSPALHLMRARELSDAKRTDDAINEYMISIRLRPNEPEAYVELGNIYIGLSRVDEGMAQIRKALEVEPGNPMALSELAFNAIGKADETDAKNWMSRVASQPRVPAAFIQKLRDAYREQFRHDWSPQ